MRPPLRTFIQQGPANRDTSAWRLAIEVTNAAPLGRSLDVIHSRHRPQSAEALSFLRTLQATVGEMARAGGRPRRR